MSDVPQTEHAEEPATNVVEALRRVMRDLPAIGKEGTGPRDQGSYKFRKADDVAEAVKPLLARHGVLLAPTVTGREIKDVSVGGKPWTDTILDVRYTAYGPGGIEDCITIDVMGIGRDSSDKGANKAMTQAFKYALTQVFCIAEPSAEGDYRVDMADRGYVSAEPEPERWPTREDVDAFTELVGQQDEDVRAALARWRDSEGITWPWTQANLDRLKRQLDNLVHAPRPRPVHDPGAAPFVFNADEAEPDAISVIMQRDGVDEATAIATFDRESAAAEPDGARHPIIVRDEGRPDRVMPTPAVGPAEALSSEPESPAPEPPEKAAEARQEAARGQLSMAALRTQYQGMVAAQRVTEVRAALAKHDMDSTGQPHEVRARLVQWYVQHAVQAQEAAQ